MYRVASVSFKSLEGSDQHGNPRVGRDGPPESHEVGSGGAMSVHTHAHVYCTVHCLPWAFVCVPQPGVPLVPARSGYRPCESRHL